MVFQLIEGAFTSVSHRDIYTTTKSNNLIVSFSFVEIQFLTGSDGGLLLKQSVYLLSSKVSF